MVRPVGVVAAALMGKRRGVRRCQTRRTSELWAMSAKVSLPYPWYLSIPERYEETEDSGRFRNGPAQSPDRRDACRRNCGTRSGRLRQRFCARYRNRFVPPRRTGRAFLEMPYRRGRSRAHQNMRRPGTRRPSTEEANSSYAPEVRAYLFPPCSPSLIFFLCQLQRLKPPLLPGSGYPGFYTT